MSVNQPFLDVTGLAKNQVVGKRIEEVIPEPSVGTVKDNYITAINESRIARWEETSEYPAGIKAGEVSIAPFYDDIGICTHLAGSVRDIAERKETEERLRITEAQLQQAQKLESIGRLAGGVAHDFNNLLTTIIGYTELLFEAQDLSDTTKEGIQEIMGSAEKAAALTQQLLAFSHG